MIAMVDVTSEQDRPYHCVMGGTTKALDRRAGSHRDYATRATTIVATQGLQCDRRSVGNPR